MALMVPAVVVPITVAGVIMTLDPAHLGAAVRPAHAVHGTVESASATLARLRRGCGCGGDDGRDANGNQSFHRCSPSLIHPHASFIRQFREIGFMIRTSDFPLTGGWHNHSLNQLV